MSRKREAVLPADVIDGLVQVAGDDVLIGGQALAFWVRQYGVTIPAGVAAITNDIDFLTDSASNRGRVQVFAAALHGATYFPNEHALTALVGQAYRALESGEVLNVDVLFAVYGLDAAAVRRRAVRVTAGARGAGASNFLVMHPMHVLRSRLVNLYKLRDKQTSKGVDQLRMAIDVARTHLQQMARREPIEAIASGRSVIQGLVTEVERMAVEDAGRKVATRYGLHVADAIDPSFIPAGPFWSKRWPSLRTLMSSAYADSFRPPSGEGDRRPPRPRP